MSASKTTFVVPVFLSVLAVAYGGCTLTSPRFYGLNYGTSGGVTPTNGQVVIQGANGQVISGGNSNQNTTGGAAVAGVVAAPAGAPPAVQLDAVAQTLRAQGYAPTGAPMRNVRPAGSLSSYTFAAQPGACYVAVAVGGPGVNALALTVSSQSGSTVGYAARGDAHPAVSFCAYEYGLYYPRLYVGAGSGEVYYQLFQGPGGTSASLAGVWGGGVAPRRAPNTPDAVTAERIAAFSRQLATRGYQAVLRPQGAMLATGEVAPMNTNLREGNCYAFAAFGGPGARDTDLYVLDAQGAILQRDEGPQIDAVAQDICVQTASQFVVRPRMATGDGPVWLVAYARAQQAGAQVTQTQLAMANTGGGGNDIDDTWNAQQNNVLSVGYQAEGPPLNRSLNEGQQQEETVNLAAGTCYAIVAVGESRVRDLDLALANDGNTILDQDYAQDPKATVRICAPAAGRYRVRVNMAGGGGAYRLGLFRWTGGTSGAGLSGIAFVRNAEVTRVLQADNYAGDTDFDIVRQQIREGANVTRNVTLRNGVCYAMVAVGGNGISDLDLTVQQGSTTVAEDRTLTAFPTARYCARAAGAHRVTISSRRGTGEFVFRMFRRQEAPAGN